MSGACACGEVELEKRCAGALERAELDDPARAFLKAPTWEFFAGDVDGDGHPDIAVAHEGGYFIVPRPFPMDTDPGIVPATLTPGVGGLHIYSSDAARTIELLREQSGDVNGDGRDDVALGVDGPDGAALVVLFTPLEWEATIDVLTVGDGVPGLWLRDHNPWFGNSGEPEYIAPSLFAIADLDLDARAEIIVGQEHTGNEGEHWETVTIIPGGDTSMKVVPADAPGAKALSGRSASAGDLDGDGYPELVIGHLEGVVTVHEGLSLSMRSAIEDPDASAYYYSSHEIITDDVNGDGLRDVVISRDYDHTPSRWRTAVLFGPLDRDVDLDDVGDAGFVIAAPGATEKQVLLGAAAPLGDFDGDGRGDIAVSLPVADPLEMATAGSFVVYGKADAEPVILGEFPGGFAGFSIPWHWGELTPVGDLNGDDRGEMLLWLFEDVDVGPREYVVYGTPCP